MGGKEPSCLSHPSSHFPRPKLLRVLFFKQKRKKSEKQTLRPHFTLHKTSLKSKMVADTRVVVIVGARTGQGRGSGVSRRSRCGEGAASGSRVWNPTRLRP